MTFIIGTFQVTKSRRACPNMKVFFLIYKVAHSLIDFLNLLPDKVNKIPNQELRSVQYLSYQENVSTLLS